MPEKTHWKSLMDREYLGHFDLPEGKDVVVRIANVLKKELKGGKKAKEHKPVLMFEGKEKGLICNATNCKALQGMYGPYVEAWRGKWVALYVTIVSSPDGDVPAIRIRPTVPKAGKVEERQPGEEG
jgi:hypothetical protein